MYKAMILSLLLSTPADTSQCGTYRHADFYLEQQVIRLFVDPDPGLEAIRSDLGIAQQSDTVSRRVETDDSICQPVVGYFIDNMVQLADSARLDQYGWEHAVFTVGRYHALLVVAGNPPDMILGQRSRLYVFDGSQYLGFVLI